MSTFDDFPTAPPELRRRALETLSEADASARRRLAEVPVRRMSLGPRDLRAELEAEGEDLSPPESPQAPRDPVRCPRGPLLLYGRRCADCDCERQA